jgi:hypothetical protein
MHPEADHDTRLVDAADCLLTVWSSVTHTAGRIQCIGCGKSEEGAASPGWVVASGSAACLCPACQDVLCGATAGI